MASDVVYFSDDQTRAYNEVVSTLRVSGIDLDEEKLSAKFTSWKDAVEKLHNPDIDDTFNEKNFYRRRLAFDELLDRKSVV